MFSTIMGIGIGIPDHCFTQNALAEAMVALLQLNSEKKEFLQKIYHHSGISKRYTVAPHFFHSKKTNPHEKVCLGMTVRNAIYRSEAPKLAVKSARDALINSGVKPEFITHIISVSCTGVMTPGIEHHLLKELKLKPETSLLGINFMGCHGAFKALKIADAIMKADVNHRILLVCTELCTLHFHEQEDAESIVLQSLFADGSAAVVIGSTHHQHEKCLFELQQFQSLLIPDTPDEMTWHGSDAGLDMTLTRRVPQLIGSYISSFVEKLTLQGSHELEWAIHPGGRAILEKIEKVKEIPKERTSSSWEIFKQFGNMSSATFLYILKHISERDDAKEDVIGLGFGPGLSIEGLLLKKLNANM